MKFTNFEIKNFKGIGYINLSLDHNSVTTLVGLNESGKTTVLQAISFFQDDDLDESQRHTLIPKKDKFRFDDSVSVAAKLSLDEGDEQKIKDFLAQNRFIVHPSHKVVQVTITKSYAFKNSQFQSQESYFNFDLMVVGKKKSSTVKESATLAATDPLFLKLGSYIKDELCPRIIYYQNFLFDFPEKIYVDESHSQNQQQRFYKQILQDILHSIDSRLSLGNDVLNKMKTGTEEDRESLNHTINLMGAKITEEVLGTWGAIFSWQNKQINVKHSSEVVSKRDKEGSDKKVTQYYVELELREGAQTYKITERSLGFNWFFAFLLFTQFRKSRATDPGETLFLLDEPASNLHSSAQQKVTTVFERLSDASKLVFSTHSHHLIRAEWLEGAYIVQNTATDYTGKKLEFDINKTNIVLEQYKSFVAKHPNQNSYFQPILDSLDYKPSELELVPEIIIFEGKNDFYTFKYAVEFLFPGKYDMKFYPGGGAGKNSAVIKLYESWGRKYIIMLDGDGAGVDSIKKYREEVGPIIDQKVFSLADVKSAWKGRSTEDLFYSSDRLKLIALFNPKQKTYSKTNFNLAMQHLLFTKQSVILTKTTLDNLESVLDFLQSKM